MFGRFLTLQEASSSESFLFGSYQLSCFYRCVGDSCDTFMVSDSGCGGCTFRFDKGETKRECKMRCGVSCGGWFFPVIQENNRICAVSNKAMCGYSLSLSWADTHICAGLSSLYLKFVWEEPQFEDHGCVWCVFVFVNYELYFKLM